MPKHDQVTAVGALSDPLRRSLYDFVAQGTEAVTREAAATELSIPLHKAKFHLDKLVGEGLLAVEYRRTSGKTGPGAGRPSKLYRRSDREFSVSLPARRYDLAGHIMATALEASLGKTVSMKDVREAARRVGNQTAEEFADRASSSNTEQSGNGFERVLGALKDMGYEPALEGGTGEDGTGEGGTGEDATVVLRNCPFASLAKEHATLICGINEAYVQGMLDALGASGRQARLEPHGNNCCVVIRGSN